MSFSGQGTARGRIEIDVSQLAQAKAAVVRAGREMDAALTGVGDAAQNMGDEVKQSSLAFNALKVAAGAALGGFVKSGLNAARSVQGIRATFTALLKDERAVNAEMDKLRELADRAGQPFLEIANGAKALLPTARANNVELTRLVQLSQQLIASAPEKSFGDAAFSLREFFSGDYVSIVDQFNLSRQAIKDLRDEADGDINAMIEGLSRMLDAQGFTTQAIEEMGATGLNAFSVLRSEVTETLATAFGPLLNEVVIPLVQAFADFVRQLRETNPELLKIATAVAAVAAAALTLNGAFNTLKSFLPGLKEGIGGLGGTLGKLAVGGAAVGIGAEIGVRAVSAITGKSPEQVMEEITTTLRQILVIIVARFGEAVVAAVKIKGIFEIVVAEIGVGINTVIGDIEKLAINLGLIADPYEEAAKAAQDQWTAINRLFSEGLLNTTDAERLRDTLANELGLGVQEAADLVTQAFEETGVRAGDSAVAAANAIGIATRQALFDQADPIIASREEEAKANLARVIETATANADAAQETADAWTETALVVAGFGEAVDETATVTADAVDRLAESRDRIAQLGNRAPEDIQFSDEQISAFADYQQEITDIQADAQQQREDLARDSAQQLVEMEADRARQLKRQAEDAAIADKRAMDDFQRQVVEARADALKAEAEAVSDLDKKQAEARTEFYAEQTKADAEYRDDTAKREADHYKKLAQIQKDSRRAIQEAAANLDAVALFQALQSGREQTNAENEQYSQAEADRRAEYQKQRVERAQEFEQKLAQDRAEGLQRIAEQRVQAEQRLADMKADFERRRQLELEDRALRAQREQEDYQRQQAQAVAQQQERLAQIDQQEREALAARETAFRETFNQLGEQAGQGQQQLLNIHQQGQAAIEQQLRAWYQNQRNIAQQELRTQGRANVERNRASIEANQAGVRARQNSQTAAQIVARNRAGVGGGIQLPSFATGGIVPGMMGQATPIIAHAGEAVFGQGQLTAALVKALTGGKSIGAVNNTFNDVGGKSNQELEAIVMNAMIGALEAIA